MLPPPPTRFSTTRGWPKRSPSFCATSRATISELLPAVNGTINRIGRSGQRASLAADCPCATCAENTPARSARVTRIMGPAPLIGSEYPSSPDAHVICLSDRSRDALGFAEALDQGAAQQKSARELGVFGGPAQFV